MVDRGTSKDYTPYYGGSKKVPLILGNPHVGVYSVHALGYILSLS